MLERVSDQGLLFFEPVHVYLEQYNVYDTHGERKKPPNMSLVSHYMSCTLGMNGLL